MNALPKSPLRRASIRRQRIGVWRERLWLPDGREVLLRPIEPVDAEPLRQSFARLSPEEVRLRFLHPITKLTPAFAQQLCDLDPATGFALVVSEPLPAGSALIGAVARLAIDREAGVADFALIVGREISGQGVGSLLVRRLIDYARRRRLDEIRGDVLEDNAPMLALCDRLGFSRSHQPEEPGMVRVRRSLRRGA